MLAMVGILGFVALLAIVAALAVAWLVLRLTKRVAALERWSSRLVEECRVLSQKIDAIPATTSAAEAAAPDSLVAMATSVTNDSGMNLNKRVQILRLSRRGESSAHIASVLSVPVAQVDLVLKLQRQAMETPLAPVS